MKSSRRLKLRLGLAGEADDEGGPQGDAGNAGAQRDDQIFDVLRAPVSRRIRPSIVSSICCSGMSM